MTKETYNQHDSELGSSLPVIHPPEYEEQFTGFIDFLGFSEVSTSDDDSVRTSILGLLLSISALRRDFSVSSKDFDNGRGTLVQPAISTFSDHIVVSYPLAPIASDMKGHDERTIGFLILNQFNRLVTSIAAAALRIGFLIRGGATIGKLYHAQGVVFGEALVEAYRIESRTATYPRVVLSPNITARLHWGMNQLDITRGDDGLYYLDYFRMLALQSAQPGDSYMEDMQSWFRAVGDIIRQNLASLEQRGFLNELAKWTWFAHEFRRGLERIPPETREAFGLSLDTIPLPN